MTLQISSMKVEMKMEATWLAWLQDLQEASAKAVTRGIVIPVMNRNATLSLVMKHIMSQMNLVVS